MPQAPQPTPPPPPRAELARLNVAVALIAASMLVYELALVRIFAVVLFADLAWLSISLAMLGIGVGGLLVHLFPRLVPAQGLARRVGALAIAQGVMSVVAVAAVLWVPVLEPSSDPEMGYIARTMVRSSLLHPLRLALLLPLLALPPTLAGAALAGVFQRRAEHIGLLYCADLLGAAVGAAAFLPLLVIMGGPDVAFALGSLGVVAGLVLRGGSRATWGLTGASLLAVGLGLRWNPLHVRYAAGSPESAVSWSAWTPLTRLSIASTSRGEVMLLDNTSASPITGHDGQIQEYLGMANRSLVYRLVDPGSHVAVLAASAGPEVAAARALGHTDLTAIDIEGEIFEAIARRDPHGPFNPYADGSVRRVADDARGAIARMGERWDVIHLLNANLFSAAGLLANAWSPSLLQTREAIVTYLRHLAPGGVLALTTNTVQQQLVPTVAAALQALGQEQPERCVAVLGGPNAVVLARAVPWTPQERERLLQVVRLYRDAALIHDPGGAVSSAGLFSGAALTDERPYPDTPSEALAALRGRGQHSGSEIVYKTLAVQAGVIAVAGFFLLVVPWLYTSRDEARRLRPVAPAIGYALAIGYGFLALQTALVHRVVVFIGRPSYAMTIVILSMLVGAGVGALVAGRLPAWRRGPAMMAGAAALASAVVCFLGVALAERYVMSAPLPARLGWVAAGVVPMSVLLGLPFPMAVRALGDRSALVPWMWAANAWAGVASGLVTMVVARNAGWTPALLLALLAYGAAAWTGARLSPRPSP